jgi:hypothetical protein
MGLNIHVHRILCFVSPEFFIATYRLYTGKLNMLFFLITLKLHIHSHHCCLFQAIIERMGELEKLE